jgi:Zinc-finger domain of monoamine-oxidase A repressor R1
MSSCSSRLPMEALMSQGNIPVQRLSPQTLPTKMFVKKSVQLGIEQFTKKRVLETDEKSASQAKKRKSSADLVFGNCHQCHRDTQVRQCGSEKQYRKGDMCGYAFCLNCLNDRYHDDGVSGENWHCPCCRKICQAELCLNIRELLDRRYQSLNPVMLLTL